MKRAHVRTDESHINPNVGCDAIANTFIPYFGISLSGFFSGRPHPLIPYN